MLHIDGSCVDLEGEGREGTGRVRVHAGRHAVGKVGAAAVVCRHPPTHSLEYPS